MAASDVPDNPISNWIIKNLPRTEYEKILPHLQKVVLAQGESLYLPEYPIRYVYFPNRGVVSLVSVSENGATLEVGVVGNEGMLGIPIILGVNTFCCQVEVTVAGDALRVRAGVLKELFNEGGILQELLLRYTDVVISQLFQSALCSRFHTMGERLSSRLLVTRDRSNSNIFKLTQQDISSMMGAHRPNVTVAARGLQLAGLIQYNRGQITILDEKGLEATACECYKTTRGKFEKFVRAQV